MSITKTDLLSFGIDKLNPTGVFKFYENIPNDKVQHFIYTKTHKEVTFGINKTVANLILFSNGNIKILNPGIDYYGDDNPNSIVFLGKIDSIETLKVILNNLEL